MGNRKLRQLLFIIIIRQPCGPVTTNWSVTISKYIIYLKSFYVEGDTWTKIEYFCESDCGWENSFAAVGWDYETCFSSHVGLYSVIKTSAE